MIRPARPADLAPALAVMAEAFGTPPMGPANVHTLVAGAPDGHLLVAEEEGRVVGTAGAVGFGPTGWLGGITVAPAARGRRLGEALTEAALAALGPRETISLLATPAGRPIYDRLGFVPELAYHVHAGAARPPGAVAGEPATREAALALDRHATGEDRTPAVEAALDGAVMTPGGSAVALRPPWAARPILARDPEAGAALLAAVMEPGLRLAVPEANAPARAALRALGAPRRREVVRMRRGARLDWRPEAVWGVFSLFFG